MTNNEIIDILKMRIAVYATGVTASAWKDIESSGASDLMEYLFPKSGKLAYYQLLLEQMKVAHNALTGGVYYLFKLPVQVEKEISDYLRREDCDIKNLVQNPKEYLKEMDSIPTDHSFSSVNIGAFSLQNIDNLLRLCASHYRYSFENNVPSYPYFE